ncbi:MAG: hypothetical protein ACO1QR_06340, partial [Chthoniobacteraceae bacterium]
MSNSEGSKLGGYELLAVRSDGFIDAQRSGGGPRVLMRKLDGADSNDARAKLVFEADRRRAGALTGPEALQLVDAFRAEGAFVFVFSHFAGRRAAVRLARGHTFTFEQALQIGRTIAKLLARSDAPHGALTLANVLIDDSGEIRLVPVLPLEGGGQLPKGTMAGDMRQLALLIGHLALGNPPASADAEPRVLARWILQPEVPARYRKVLQSMLGPAGPRYKSWQECVRDLDLALGNASRTAKGSATGALAGAVALVLAAGGGTWAWWQFSQPAETQAQATALQTTATPAAATQQESATAQSEGSPDEAAAMTNGAPAPAALPADKASTLAYLRTMGDALSLCERGDFAKAMANLTEWTSENPQHPFREDVLRQVARIQLAQTAAASVTELGDRARGAQVKVDEATQGVVTKLQGGQVTLAVPSQFGNVEKTVPLATLPIVSIGSMLAQADAQGGSTHGAAFLLGSTRFTEANALLSNDLAGHIPLHTWSREWKKLVHDRDAMLGLEQVTALLAKGASEDAVRAFDRIRREYRDSEIFAVVMKEDVAILHERLAALVKQDPEMLAKVVGSGYPGLPALTLSSSVPKGDPEYQQVVSTVQWLVHNGGWDQHQAALEKAIAAAGKLGPWNQHPKNLERILTQRAPSLMLAQATALRLISPSVVERFCKEEYNREFITWLFTNPRAMQLLAGTLKPQDKPARVLELWRECWADDKQSGEPYMALALAVAVVFDEPIKLVANYYGYDSYESSSAEGTEISALERYRFFRDCAKKNSLRVPLAEMQPHELVYVVDSPVPNEELAWAQKHVNLSRRNWGQAYGMIRYRMDKAAGGRQIYKRYTLAQIEDEGGICGDQAYFAAHSAKANGIPAMVIGGEGDRGGHAWFGYQISRNEWNLEAGRFTSDNYAAGTSEDPQTRRTIKEHELKQFATPERRTAGWADTDRYLQLSDLFERNQESDLARTSLDQALRVTPKH